MRRIREILRLHYECALSLRDIARACRVGVATAHQVIDRARLANITWPLGPDVTDAALEKVMYLPPAAAKTRPEPDWTKVHEDLRRHKGMTLRLAWIEYRREHPTGLGYTQFCSHYRTITKSTDVTMHQVHVGGERMTVDYAGPTVPIVNRVTGEIVQAVVFVATLDASGYTYCEASRSQDVADFVAAHERAFAYFDGLTAVVVPDNLKSAVTHPDYYDPELNRTYADFATHYGIAIVPARVRRPKDKAKVERHVLLVEQAVLAPLRDRRFFSVAQANAAIRPLMEAMNHRPFQKLDGCRHSLYLSVDKPALRPLPQRPYEFARWPKARVNVDYHIEVDHNYYSVPFSHARKEVEVRLTAAAVEVFLGGQRIASHQRMSGKGHYSTVVEHMPSAHRRYKERTPSRLVQDGGKIGPNTQAFMEAIVEHRRHPEQAYRALLGVLRLGKTYPADRVEAAANVCLESKMYTSKEMRLVLQNATDRVPKGRSANTDVARPSHENVRGGAYFASSAQPGGGEGC